MEIHKIRELDDTTIQNEVTSLQKELMNLRLGNAIGTIENPIRIRHKRRDLARMKTVLRERELKIR